MNGKPRRPTSLTRLAVIQEYQPAVDACDELQDLATSESLRQLAIVTRQTLMELLDDRLALQGPMDSCPRAHESICDTDRYRRLSRERLELETMIVEQLAETRRQIWAQAAESNRDSLERPRPALYATHDTIRSADAHPGALTDVDKPININKRILHSQGKCNLAYTRCIYRWLTDVGPSNPSEIPPSPPPDEMSWDCLY